MFSQLTAARRAAVVGIASSNGHALVDTLVAVHHGATFAAVSGRPPKAGKLATLIVGRAVADRRPSANRGCHTGLDGLVRVAGHAGLAPSAICRGGAAHSGVHRSLEGQEKHRGKREELHDDANYLFGENSPLS
jgi:hypothetical protein